VRKFVLIIVGAALIVGAGWYLWQNRFIPTTIFDIDPGYYTFGTVDARIKVPDGWTYSTSENRDFAAFQSPDFKASSGSSDPFDSSPIAEGAVMIIPLFYFEESNPQPVTKPVSLDGEDGDIEHGSTAVGNLVTQYDRLRIELGGVRYVLFALEYPTGFEGADEIVEAAVASFEFK
jgi:hypothetical protein